MALVASGLSATYPETHAGRNSSLTARRDRSVGELRSALWVPSAISALVLLLGCINVATLLHAHGIERMRELSVRAAIGASRSRLIRPMLVESLLLGGIGSLAGLLVAHWAVQLISSMIPRFVAEAAPLHLDGTVAIFGCLAGVLAGLVSGVIPAWLLTRGEVSDHLKDGTTSVDRARVQDALVAAQVTLAVVALVGASLMVRSFARLLAVPLGIDSRGVVLADLTLPSHQYRDRTQVLRFYEDVLSEARVQPGVASAALTTLAPMSFVPWNLSYVVEGDSPAARGHEPECDYVAATSDYFRTLGIGIVEGRAFTGRDDARRLPVAVVDRAFVRKHLTGGSAIGRRLAFPAMGGRWLEIVGVVENVRNWGPDGVAPPGVYVPLLQAVSANVTLAARAQGDTRVIPADLRNILRKADPGLPSANLRTMDEVISRTAATRRLAAKAVTGFSIIALGMAGLGLYGTLMRGAVRRSREIGVRMAVGARRVDILSLFLRRGLLLSGLGLVLGLSVALPLTPLLSSLLFETAPLDPVAIALVPLVLVSVTLGAAVIPGCRAAAVDPIVAIRCE